MSTHWFRTCRRCNFLLPSSQVGLNKNIVLIWVISRSVVWLGKSTFVLCELKMRLIWSQIATHRNTFRWSKVSCSIRSLITTTSSCLVAWWGLCIGSIQPSSLSSLTKDFFPQPTNHLDIEVSKSLISRASNWPISVSGSRCAHECDPKVERWCNHYFTRWTFHNDGRESGTIRI